MTDERKEEYLKYLDNRARGGIVKRHQGSIKCYVNCYDEDSEWIMFHVREFLRKTNNYYRNIYRSEYVGSWKHQFYKKVGKFYFSLFWYREPLKKGISVLDMYTVLKERAALRKLMCTKTSINELFYNGLLDLFGPNRIFSDPNPLFTPKMLKIICRKVMKMTYKEIVDSYEKTLDYLMSSTRPKSGIIINRSQGPEFRGRSGAAYGRRLAKKCEFLKIYDSTKTSKENIINMRSKGLGMSYSTYLKYKKEIFLHADDSIKKLELI